MVPIYTLWNFFSFDQFRLNPSLDASLHKIFFYIASWIFRSFPWGLSALLAERKMLL